jgi:hypothetical protein
VVQKIDGILHTTWNTVIILWTDEDVSIIRPKIFQWDLAIYSLGGANGKKGGFNSLHRSTPLPRRFPLELSQPGNIRRHDLLIEDWQVESRDIQDFDRGSEFHLCVIEDVFDDFDDLWSDTRDSRASCDDGDFLGEDGERHV